METDYGSRGFSAVERVLPIMKKHGHRSVLPNFSLRGSLSHLRHRRPDSCRFLTERSAPLSSSTANRQPLAFLIWIALGIAFSKLLPLSSGGSVAEFLWNGAPNAGTVSNAGNYAGRIFIAIVFILWARRFEHDEKYVLFTTALIGVPIKFGLVLAYYQDLFDPHAMASVAAFANGACQMIIETPLYILLARQTRFKEAAVCIAAGTIGYTVLSYVANLIPSYHAQLAILAFSPFGALACWILAYRSTPSAPSIASENTDTPRQPAKRLLVVLVLVCTARSLLRVLGSSKTWDGSGLFPLSSGPVGPLVLISSCLACLALVWLVFVLPKKHPSRSCTTGLIVVVGSLQIVAIGETLDFVSSVLTTVAISACELFSAVLVWMAFLDCVQRTQMPSWRTRGFMVLSETACTVATMSMLPDGVNSSVVVMVFLYAMVAALLVLEKTDSALCTSPRTAEDMPSEIAGTRANEEEARTFAEHYGLSPREQDVLLLLLAGRTRAEVGNETGLADGTVRTHVTNIHKKIGIHSREELIERFEAETNGVSFDGKS